MSRSTLRVLIVGPSLRYLGGQAVQAQRLLQGLSTVDSLEVEYLVVDPVLPGPLSFLQRIPFVRTLVTSAAYISALLRRVHRFDVLHVFSASYWSFLIAPTPALIVGRLFGRRVILNYHSGEADDHLRNWGWHAKPLLRLADEIVVPTEFLVSVFGDHGLKAVPIANHLNEESIVYRQRSTLAPRFLSNRNFETHYNVGAILEAFAGVQMNTPEASLTVVGAGSLRDELHAQAGRLALRNVTFTGPVAPQRMAEFYADADVFVNASLIDNMPLSILEAYAAGLPVVTSDAGGIPWIARDGVTARVVPAGNLEALRQGMLDVLASPDSALKRAAQARDYVVENFSWSRVGGAWVRTYSGSADRASAG